MIADGLLNMLEVYHTDVLLLGDNNGDYTISLAFRQTILCNPHYYLQEANHLYGALPTWHHHPLSCNNHLSFQDIEQIWVLEIF